MTGLIYKTDNQIPYLTHHLLKNGVDLPMLEYPGLKATGLVSHGFTTRMGGVSEGIFSTLNLSFSRGDDEKAVQENYRRVAEALGTKPGHIVTSDQTHTTNVIRVGKADGGNGVTRPRAYTDVDGMITDEPEVMLATFYADCVPLFVVDPVHRAVGLSHSGWKGTVHRMGEVTINAMKREFQSNPKDLIVAIGPSICQECYEVSSDVAEEFSKEFSVPLSPENAVDRKLLYPTIPGKYQLNLWEANRRVLLDAGILPEHLEATSICTCCNSKLLFSHRASHGKRGNLGAFLMLK